jgi:hypothetical protein
MFENKKFNASGNAYRIILRYFQLTSGEKSNMNTLYSKTMITSSIGSSYDFIYQTKIGRKMIESYMTYYLLSVKCIHTSLINR